MYLPEYKLLNLIKKDQQKLKLKQPTKAKKELYIHHNLKIEDLKLLNKEIVIKLVNN